MAAKRHCVWLSREKTVGTAFQQAVGNPLGLDHAAQLWGGIDQDRVPAPLAQIVSGGESGDAAANNNRCV